MRRKSSEMPVLHGKISGTDKRKKMREESFKAIEFTEDGRLKLIDQRILPGKLDYTYHDTSADVAFAIKDMIVRGAPAIGGAAGYGIYFAAKEAKGDWDDFLKRVEVVRTSRPTAVNLMWACDRMVDKAKKTDLDLEALLQEAHDIVSEDKAMNHRIGEIGSAVVRPGATILTHCNTGALATCGWGTALGVIKTAYEQGKVKHVYADETRPRFQGARLTAWELVDYGIPSTLIPDSAAASLIRDGKIDCVILGADRITTDGDVANKLGTFTLSCICKLYGVPFYSVAPTTTIDFNMKEGKDIPIEERTEDEVKRPGGVLVAPEEIEVYNPSFDVTPHQNITGIITEKGIIYPPFDVNIKKLKEEMDR